MPENEFDPMDTEHLAIWNHETNKKNRETADQLRTYIPILIQRYDRDDPVAISRSINEVTNAIIALGN